ncbi:hypothetical protein Ssi03_62280 [Sphaerisporangium siamense]|uniref:Uncharacterized protein n=1 Tax=Sphaerisporangium siamense TaxID=795645 RepID=A0A7W7D937_9ACTN|nr:hypothetical protein [Sphaerisporangium siamense]MBB4702539.1 hypothetical protein [Sphaerisporangium siamense]GII88238.1 hypothetical protein Ssi03_62280 [Sphaerisporangium siamense]
MGEPLGYVVVTYNQASGQPELTGYGMSDLEAARAERDEEQVQTEAVGRGERHIVAAVVALDQDDGGE